MEPTPEVSVSPSNKQSMSKKTIGVGNKKYCLQKLAYVYQKITSRAQHNTTRSFGNISTHTTKVPTSQTL